MSTKLIRIPSNIPLSVITEAIKQQESIPEYHKSKTDLVSIEKNIRDVRAFLQKKRKSLNLSNEDNQKDFNKLINQMELDAQEIHSKCITLSRDLIQIETFEKRNG